MRTRPFTLALVLPLLAATAFAQSAPPVTKAAKPGKPQVTALLKAKLAKTPFRVSDVLDDVGGGRFPVLYTTSTKHCDPHPGMSEEDIRAERKAGNNPDICVQAVYPHLGILGSSGGELSVESLTDLPTTTTPSTDLEGKFLWGITPVKDFDGDGKPELLLIYSYAGAVEPGVGTTNYRELTLVNLELKPTVAVNVILRTDPEAETLDSTDFKYKFSPATAKVPMLTLDGTISALDEKADEKRPRKETRVYLYDATGDKWSLVEQPKPAAKAKPTAGAKTK